MNRLYLLIGLLFTTYAQVNADAFAKPEMIFKVENKTSVDISNYELIHLQSPYEDFHMFDTIQYGDGEFGSHGFTNCDGLKCRTSAYSFKRFHKLIIKANNRTWESDVFEKRWRSPIFQVTINETHIDVTNNLLTLSARTIVEIILAIIISFVIELLFAWMFFGRKVKTFTRQIFQVNAMTVSSIWILFTLITYFFRGFMFWELTAILEFLVLVAEFVLFRKILKDKVYLGNLIGFVVIGNIFSFSIGMFLFLLLILFGIY